MKLKLYMFITFILLASAFVTAKEIKCYSTVNNSWYTTNNTTCDVRLFDVQDLLILTSNFDRTDCTATNTYCEGMDINKDGTVNGFDLRLFTPSLCVDNCTVTEVCGNGVCASTESCFSCSADCGACPVPAKARKSSGGGGAAPRIINASNATNTTSTAIVTLNISNNTNSESNNPIDVVLTDAQATGGSNVNSAGNTADNSKTNNATNAGNSLTGFATSGNGGSQKSNTVIAIILIVVVVILIITIIYLARRRDSRKQK
jgi:hypothetical protein